MKVEDVPDGPLLVDTDVFSWIIWERKRYEEFRALLQGHLLAISFATVGELRSGALKAFGERRQALLEDRIARYFVILTVTDIVTWHWATIAARLGGQLKGGGVNDMWTAATALAQPSPLPIVTGNLSDFQRISTVSPLVVVHPDV